MITLTGQYAIRAVVYLAEEHRYNRISALRIADEVRVPANYLGKILHVLAQAGILDSIRGPRGGYRLVRPADQVTLADVLAPFEEAWPGDCLLSRTGCPHGAGCHARLRCRALSAGIDRFLRTTRIAELADPAGPRHG